MTNKVSMFVIVTLSTACASVSQAPEHNPSPKIVVELVTTEAVTTMFTDAPTQSVIPTEQAPVRFSNIVSKRTEVPRISWQTVEAELISNHGVINPLVALRILVGPNTTLYF